TFNTIGNGKEWYWNASDKASEKRYILGGAFGEPTYMFHDPEAQPALGRLPSYGIRCVKYTSASAATSAISGPIEVSSRDRSREKPVPDEMFRVFRSFYSYDKTDLNAAVDSVDESSPDWRKEKVIFRAAYGNERVIAYLFLPRKSAPPYQTVVYFPPSSALRQGSSRNLSDIGIGNIDFIMRSGRAVVYPVYKSTYERRDGLLTDRPNTTSSFRAHVIQWYQDFARTVDYLETRKEIDTGKLAYYGVSWGGVMGAIIPALEKRLQTAVLVAGGFFQQKTLPEVDQINFAPRVKIPVLMLNGRYDFFFPPETSQVPMFRLFSTPEKDKRHVLFDAGHAIRGNESIRWTLDWLDRYLGPVKN
ncbi:MAG: alpha/beta hydrolase family protein, partial [Acidobacteriota bacterium]